MTYYVAGIPYSGELYHHGIKGQRWGVKNGPPYPLKAKDHSKSEQNAGWRNSLQKVKDKISNSSKGKVKGDEAVELVANVLAVAAVTAYAAWANNKRTKALIEKGKTYLDNRMDMNAYIEKRQSSNDAVEKYMKERSVNNKDKKTGLYLKDREFSMEEDVAAVNPEYDNYSKAKNNCALCSATYDLRRRGYDVTANFTADDNGVLIANVASWYNGAQRLDLAGNMALTQVSIQPSIGSKKASEAIKTLSNDRSSRGIIGLTWGYYGGGHGMSYEVDNNGSFKLIDSQCNKIYSGNEALDILKHASAISSFRTDNLEPNFDMMKRDGVFR